MGNRNPVPHLTGECHAARPLRRLTVTFIITLRAGICHIHHPSMQELLHNSDLRLGLTFDCNYQALLDRGARLLIQFNAFRHLLLCGDILKKKPISPSGFAFERWFIQSSTRTLLTLLFCSVVNCTCAFKWSMADPRYLWGGGAPTLGRGVPGDIFIKFSRTMHEIQNNLVAKLGNSPEASPRSATDTSHYFCTTLCTS